MRRRVPITALAVLALLVAPVPVRAASDMDGLLDGLLGPREPQGRVVVAARIEPEGDRLRLVVDLRPLGDARLVADPGAVLRAEEAEGIAWLAPEAKAFEPGRGYFDGPVTLALPFRAEGAGEVRAKVDYAWCLVGFQCLFGERELRIPLSDLPSG